MGGSSGLRVTLLPFSRTPTQYGTLRYGTLRYTPLHTAHMAVISPVITAGGRSPMMAVVAPVVALHGRHVCGRYGLLHLRNKPAEDGATDRRGIERHHIGQRRRLSLTDGLDIIHGMPHP